MADYKSFTKKFITASNELNSLYSQFNMQANFVRIVGDYLYVQYGYSLDKLPNYVNQNFFPSATSFKLSDLSIVDNYVNENLNTSFEFGPEALLPLALDSRLVEHLPPPIVEAAMHDGVARQRVDLDTYPKQLKERMAELKERVACVLSKDEALKEFM